MSGLFRFDFYPKDWFLDTRDLSNAAKGIYVDLFSAMYARGGPLPYDEQELCGLCGCKTVRSLRPLLQELIEKEKVHVIDGFLVNNRTMEEIAATNKNIEAGRAGGKAPKTSHSLKTLKTHPPFGGNTSRIRREHRPKPKGLSLVNKDLTLSYLLLLLLLLRRRALTHPKC